ncbi:MAG: hypothetical protein NTV54_15100, partial [Ignavibacteriales bacterium]|nr:hypothetical protein [Ignavibacteriales bacterium]
RAFKALPHFEWKASFATYFHKIVFNVCATMMKRRDPHFLSALSIDDDDPAIQLDSDSVPDIDYDAKEFRCILHEEIERLHPLLSSLLTLFLENDLGYNEIVAVTNLPLGTVKNRLFRGRMLLRSAILRRYEKAHSI